MSNSGYISLKSKGGAACSQETHFLKFLLYAQTVMSIVMVRMEWRSLSAQIRTKKIKTFMSENLIN